MKKILIIAFLIGITFSCNDFDGWNVDDKSPSEVPAGYLITSAQRDFALRTTSTSVNYNVFKLFAQYWTETQYTDEVNYDLTGRDIGGNFFLYMYRDVLMDIKEAKKIITADEFISATSRDNQLAVAEIMEVFVWHILVDTFGDIPYTEALQGVDNLLPKYDDDATIYADLFSRLDAALSQLNSGDSYGTADLIYSGSTSAWKKFGNSIKLRMAVRTADFDSGRASTKASEAVASGVFTSSADNAAFPFELTPPNTNPIWTSLVQSGRNDYVVANTFVDIIAPLNDPRASVFLADNKVPYLGATYGVGVSYVDYTHIGDLWHTEDLEGILMSFSEVQFLLAEAVERNLISGSAESYYNAAVTASIVYWGGSESEAATYIAQPSVAYTTAGSSWKEVIGNQKYISLYGRGFEAWSSWRMLDYPNSMTRPAISQEAVPRRYIYGNDDADVNGDNYNAAAAAMGGDAKSSRVFWDIVGVGN